MKASFFLAGDAALSIEVGDDISLKTNARVSLAEHAILNAGISGIREILPTYCSLLICYDPAIVEGEVLIRKLRDIMEGLPEEAPDSAEGKTVEIPVLYGDEFGYDLKEVADHEGVSEEELIRMHASHPARVYMFGFLPGLGYLGSDNGIRIPRRTTPRTSVLEGSVIIWKDQTILFPNTSPTGWNVIGRTPLKICDMAKEDPFLFHTGDTVKFVPIDREEYNRISRRQKGST